MEVCHAPAPQRLVVAIIQVADREPLLAALNARGYGVTLLATEGGFLRRANVTLLIGVADWQVRVVRQLLREHCRRREVWATPTFYGPEFLGATPILVEVGGAVAFTLRLVRYERLVPPPARSSAILPRPAQRDSPAG